MSRIGKQKVSIPKDVNIRFKDDYLNVTGPNGQLQIKMFKSINLEICDDSIQLTLKKEVKKEKAIWGLARSLVNNMVVGVSQGFAKKLEINGVGYKAHIKPGFLILALGFSHDIIYPIPQNISITCLKNIIKISGCDKQLVGQVSADIRSLRKPEPYKGKGIKYVNEEILRKEGKKK